MAVWLVSCLLCLTGFCFTCWLHTNPRSAATCRGSWALSLRYHWFFYSLLTWGVRVSRHLRVLKPANIPQLLMRLCSVRPSVSCCLSGSTLPYSTRRQTKERAAECFGQQISVKPIQAVSSLTDKKHNRFWSVWTWPLALLVCIRSSVTGWWRQEHFTVAGYQGHPDRGQQTDTSSEWSTSDYNSEVYGLTCIDSTSQDKYHFNNFFKIVIMLSQNTVWCDRYHCQCYISKTIKSWRTFPLQHVLWRMTDAG